jgi:transposase-like protein
LRAQQELTYGVLLPLIEAGLGNKQIAHRLGVSEPTVKRARKLYKLRATDIVARKTAHARKSVIPQSSDPIRKLKMNHAQYNAAMLIRTAFSEGSGLKGQNLLQMMLSRGTGFGSHSDRPTQQDRINDAKKQIHKWELVCKAERIDYRCAIDICGKGISVWETGRRLGYGYSKSKSECLRGLDRFCEMRGWLRDPPRRRYAWMDQKAIIAGEYAPISYEKDHAPRRKRAS